MDALPGLFKEPGIVEEATLRRLYGPKVTPTLESLATAITPDMAKKCLEALAPLTTPHTDGWLAEHLLALCDDTDYEAAITNLVGPLAACDVTDAT
jgi:hypothetical protein